MSDPDGEPWIFTLRLPRGLPNPARFVARLLKHVLRTWGVRATAIDVPSEVRQLRARVAMLEAENAHLQEIIGSLAARVAAQSELLSQRAERRKTG